MRTHLTAVLSLSLLLSACTQPQGADMPLVTTVDFARFDAQQGTLQLREGLSRQLSLDAEPEYITVSADSRFAYVTLQESNAVATLDLRRGEVTGLKSLGFKDHAQAGQGLDASDRDGPGGTGSVNIRPWPVRGAFMPDAIASVTVGGRTFLLTANEGDTRDHGPAFSDEVRVSALTLDPAAFPNAAELKGGAALGRLTVSRVDADPDGDGDADQLVAFGARSLSVWDTDLNLVADTGDLFERVTAERSPTTFNSGGTAESFDTRSDNKGPEPEGVTTGVVGGRTLAFVGLERTGGIAVLDVSSPAHPALTDYVRHGDPAQAASSGLAGDLAPEGLLFIPASQSPSGRALLVASHEGSGSVTLYTAEDSGRLTLTGRHQAAPYAFDQGVAEITAFDPASRHLYVVNGLTGGLDVLSIADPARPTFVRSVSLGTYGRAANSVAIHEGIVAVAVEAAVKTDPGLVVFLRAADGSEAARAVPVGPLPDMLTFTPDGQAVVVANEGEPSPDGRVDPAGSVSIINLRKALAQR